MSFSWARSLTVRSVHSLGMDERQVLDRVVTHYIESGDFNGLYVDKDRTSREELEAVDVLVRDGLVQVVGDEDYVNPHIRPWASKRTTDAQIEDIRGIADSRYGFCLYPTLLAMAGRPELATFDAQPYRRQLAEGNGHLELAYFTVDVVEQYRNDPRYHFWFGDAEVHFGIGDDAYLNPEEAERDKIASLRVGFAYDRTTLRSDKVTRLACAFPRPPIARLLGQAGALGDAVRRADKGSRPSLPSEQRFSP